MKSFKVYAKESGAVIAQNCVIADGMLERMVGLLNHSSLPESHGLLLNPCNQVHTFFMRFPIDAVFLSADNEVLACLELWPWRLSRMIFKARKILELPLGSARKANLHAGQKLEFEPC